MNLVEVLLKRSVRYCHLVLKLKDYGFSIARDPKKLIKLIKSNASKMQAFLDKLLVVSILYFTIILFYKII